MRGQISLADSLLPEHYNIMRVLHVSPSAICPQSFCGIYLKYIHIHGFHKL